ncbi:glycosyltransferase [Microlunatus parietis]|uniref:UDP:flavonoid glycosyltransferase YjiC (YdhE family) n=1 Tax=Microlunatus parietis TaxID=682979 RepID=A0A7Y9I525_9ACTN|nr:nucleotide disphospho-sugar-binding domain-containing protein [Microlunatus parietis]NYE70432.1 UDP:flavonoid glycosyltransferase YjiC (YdhE family) [Microlunatus parietis]
MPSLLICSTSAHGHVAPLLPIASELVTAGFRVRFLTGAKFRSAVERTGAEHLALPADADLDDHDLDGQFPDRARLTGVARMKFDLVQLFLKPVPAQLRAVREAVAAEPTDAVLAEPLFVGGGAYLLQRSTPTDPMVIIAGTLPLSISSRDTAPFGFGLQPLKGPLGRLRNAVLQFAAEKIVFGSVQRTAERIIRETTGKDLPCFVMDWPAQADAIVQFSVPGFEYPRSDLPDRVHFVGPLSLPTTEPATLPDWWADLDQDQAVIIVNQGTVANQDYDQLIAPALTALGRPAGTAADPLIVVTTGGRPLDTLPQPLPDNVRAATYLPFDQLLPKADLMITNGGYGGVHAALRHGVPLIVAGTTEDKVEVGARVTYTGVGINLATNRPTPPQLAEAVRTVLGDGRYTAAATRLGNEIGRAPGVAAIRSLIEERRRTAAGGLSSKDEV